MKTKYWLLTLYLIVAISALGNAQWVKQSGGLPATWSLGMAIDACSPSVAIIAVYGAQPNVYLTEDAGAHFIPLTVPGTVVEGPIDITIVDSLHIWFVSSTSIYATTNGSAS